MEATMTHSFSPSPTAFPCPHCPTPPPRLFHYPPSLHLRPLPLVIPLSPVLSCRCRHINLNPHSTSELMLTRVGVGGGHCMETNSVNTSVCYWWQASGSDNGFSHNTGHTQGWPVLHRTKRESLLGEVWSFGVRGQTH